MTGSNFSDEIAQEIFGLLIEGKSLAEICRMRGMPKVRAVMTRLERDEKFKEDYTRARILQAEADADAISDMAAQVRSGKLEPNAARVAIDAYKWTAGRRNPKVYGNKLGLDGAGEGGAIVIQWKHADD